MNGAASSGHEVRPRPVADAPIDGLLERADELAKRWALALLAARPLEEIGRVALADIAALAPSLCSSVLLELRSDDALELEESLGESAARDPWGVRRDPLRLTWDDEPRELVAAVEALRGVLWDALVRAAGAARFAAPSDRLLSDLADRLAHVCSVVLTRSLPARTGARPHAAPLQSEDAIRREAQPWAGTAVAADYGNEARSSAPRPADGPAHAPSGAGARAGSPRAVLVDEFSEPAIGGRGLAGSRAGRPTESASTAAGTSQQTAGADARALPWDIPLDAAVTEPEQTAREASERRKADVPTISIIRRRRPRERE